VAISKVLSSNTFLDGAWERLSADFESAEPPPYPRQLRLVRAIATVLCLLATAAAVVKVFDLKTLVQIGPLAQPMSANAVSAFLILGLLLHLSGAQEQRPLQDKFSVDSKSMLILALSAAVIFIAVIALLQDLRLLLNRSASVNTLRPSAEMSFLCSTAVILLGTVGGLREAGLAPRLRELLALGAFAVGYLALMGYVYGAESLYRMGATSVSVSCALCIVLASCACLALPPYYGLMRPIVSQGAGGMLVRRLLPVALFVAPAVDLVQTKVAVHVGESSLALVGLAQVALLVLLIWGTGRAAQVAQSHRRRAEEHVKSTQERLLLALQSAGGGAWDLDLVRRVGWWSPEMYRLWHVQPRETVSLDESLELIDPRDRERMMRTMMSAVEKHALYECEFRLRYEGSGGTLDGVSRERSLRCDRDSKTFDRDYGRYHLAQGRGS
jgi:PAS domain-containing protein